MTLPRMIAYIAKSYAYERAKPFAPSSFRRFATVDLVKEAEQTIALWPFDLRLRASVGRSQWAAVPWLAFMDPRVATSASRGIYVVILINAVEETVVMSLGHATYEVTSDHGREAGRVLLRKKAKYIQHVLADYLADFDTSPISLGSPANLPKDYEHGFGSGRTYAADQMEKDVFLADLYRLLQAYKAYTSRVSI